MDKVFAGGLVLFGILAVFAVVVFYGGFGIGISDNNITNFEQCAAAGYPVQESYPRQCHVPGGSTFTEIPEMNEQLCRQGGGNWNECSNKCIIDNQGVRDAYCTMNCEALCECGGIAGFSCPAGYQCIMPSGVIDALGYCVYSASGPNGVPPADSGMVDEQECRGTSGSIMSLREALSIAGSDQCADTGSLTDRHSCNPNSGTWWIDIEPFVEMEGCNPACVINADTGASEVNWRCTGLIAG